MVSPFGNGSGRLPVLTNLQKLSALFWGCFWAGLGGVTTGGSDVIAGLFEDSHHLDWNHVLHRAYAGIGIGIWAYWQQQKALFTPPPVLVEDTRATIRTPAGQPDIVIDTHKETMTVKPDPNANPKP